ncbi:MAG: carboxypeptidase-like regulatory domain-containing protein, partial [Desulfotomaculaceae bacterium]
TLDPQATTYTGIGLMDDCPQTGTCVGLSTNSAAAPHTLVKNIPAGTYYIMIDTWAAPNNIPAFTLNVSIMDPPPPIPGNNCDLPLLISSFPYTDVNTTVGRGNDYSETCLGSYDSGEDILYEFTLTETRIVTITMDPGTTTYTGIGLMNTCPQAGSACLASATGSSTTLRTITETLGAGTYFIMIDTWSAPYNITSFTLNVTAELPPPPVAAINPYPANGAGAIPASVILSWSPGVGGGAADGYLLYLGTDNPPTNLANGTDLGNVLSYDPTPDLDLATEYFWQIVPYNSVGNAPGNAVWSFTTTLGVGSLEGFTTNGYGVPLGGVNISIDNGISIFNTVSGPNGAYEFASIAAAPYVLTATLPGYNTTIMDIQVDPAVTYLNITMARPAMAVTPNPYNVTVNPNEMLEGALNIVNNGDGSLTWTAEVVYPETDALTQYPDYLSVRGEVPTDNAPTSTGRAPSPAPFNGMENTLASRGPEDMAYCYVASPAGGLSEGPASFILNNPAALTNFGSAASDFIASADYANGIWYGVIYGGTFGTINPTTGVFSTIGSTGNFSGISYNWSNGTMYGLTFEGVLQTINLSTGATTTVGNAGTDGFIAMEIDNDGVAYAANISTDEMGTINLTTGAWTSIGSFGFNANYAQDMSCDHTTNELYWAAYDTGGKLVLVNKATGATSLVGAFPGGAEITGFAIPMAPGGISGGWLTLGSYEGTVGPSGNYSNPAYFNAQGAEAGEVYTAEVIFTSEPNVGTITVPVTMVIAGPALDMPTDLVAILSNPVTGQVSLSWNFNPTDAFLNFAIRRNGVVVGYTANNNYVDMLPTFGIYDYTVQAVYDEGMSAPAGPVQVE